MRKIILSIFTGIALICGSCSNDEFNMPEVTSEKYNVKMKSRGSSQIPALFINAKNSVGGVEMSLPMDGEVSEPIFIKNEDLQATIEMYMASQSGIADVFKNINYLEFLSNANFSISYNDANGRETIIPDMLKEDGSLTKTIKFRFTFDRIMVKIHEPLSSHLNLPVFGELPLAYGLSYKKTADGMLIYLDHTALSSYIPLLPVFQIDPQIIAIINSILPQYQTSADTLEIGFYLNKIN